MIVGALGISTHAPAGGATCFVFFVVRIGDHFYSRPCGRGDRSSTSRPQHMTLNFYSRPCGRGDSRTDTALSVSCSFLLTPLREGRHQEALNQCFRFIISTHAPAGGATTNSGPSSPTRANFYSRPCGRGDIASGRKQRSRKPFLLTPLREGRLSTGTRCRECFYFYSRPCGRGDSNFPQVRHEVLRQIAER